MPNVKINQKVKVGVEIDANQIVQFFTTVKEIFSDRLILNFPKSKIKLKPYLQEGDTINISIYSSLGILLQSSLILEAPTEAGFEVEYSPNNYKQIQRRKYIRANEHYRIILQVDNTTITALTEDIGGGAVRIICDKILELDKIISARLFLPKIEKSVVFNGKVVKKPHFKENEYLLDFVEISDNDRDKIIKRCLELEATNLRNKI